MRPIISEADRQERMAQVKRQLGSPKLSPQKTGKTAVWLKLQNRVKLNLPVSNCVLLNLIG